MRAVPKKRGGEPDAHKGIRGVTVPFVERMNNATTLLLQRRVREYAADQMRWFFFSRDSLVQSFAEWLVEELSSNKYKVPREISQDWIAIDQVILLVVEPSAWAAHGAPNVAQTSLH